STHRNRRRAARDLRAGPGALEELEPRHDPGGHPASSALLTARPRPIHSVERDPRLRGRLSARIDLAIDFAAESHHGKGIAMKHILALAMLVSAAPSAHAGQAVSSSDWKWFEFSSENGSPMAPACRALARAASPSHSTPGDKCS